MALDHRGIKRRGDACLRVRQPRRCLVISRAVLVVLPPNAGLWWAILSACAYQILIGACDPNGVTGLWCDCGATVM